MVLKAAGQNNCKKDNEFNVFSAWIIQILQSVHTETIEGWTYTKINFINMIKSASINVFDPGMVG